VKFSAGKTCESATAARHTFVVLAYQDSPYLEECLQSLVAQTVKSGIIITTSTPSEFITSLADKYGLNLIINPMRTNATDDMKFAFRQVETDYFTYAHQDDIYHPDYLKYMLKMTQSYPDFQIVFSDYYELKKGKVRSWSLLLLIKRLILMPFYLFDHSLSSPSSKKRLLALGDPICYPTLIINKSRLEQTQFDFLSLESLSDWYLLTELSQYPGSFVFCPKKLLYRRLHNASRTIELVNTRDYYNRVLKMFSKYWPRWIAVLLAKLFSLTNFLNKE